jgi:hypothetical protein
LTIFEWALVDAATDHRRGTQGHVRAGIGMMGSRARNWAAECANRAGMGAVSNKSNFDTMFITIEIA